jgi:hypothetical protein
MSEQTDRAKMAARRIAFVARRRQDAAMENVADALLHIAEAIEGLERTPERMPERKPERRPERKPARKPVAQSPVIDHSPAIAETSLQQDRAVLD